MIGVITPIYNAEKTIIRALDSVQKQNCSHTIHHYIYNDGSTDNSRNIIREYYHENNERAIDVIDGYTQNNGQSAARNILIKQAIRDNCEYIAFLDADDEWYPDHVEKSIENLKHCDISYSTPQLTDGSQDVIAYEIGRASCRERV
jgi:glycosyltransferase involved in cell wall biosynthesis